MNYKETLDMADKVGAVSFTPPPLRAVRGVSMTYEQLEQFAALVAAKEREECAKVLDAVYKVQEARRAYADSTTLGGANHQYFSQVMTAIASASDKIRARGQQ